MKYSFVILLLLLVSSCADSEEIFSFQIKGNNDALVNNPVTISLDELNLLDFDLKNGSKSIPFDFNQEAKQISFIHSKENTNQYTLVGKTSAKETPKRLSAIEDDGDLILSNGETKLVSYRYEMNYPPKGADSIFKKSGYIHPILTPKGDTLTRINPPDHWHHYGVWGPWTHTRIDTSRVDFWNLVEKQGTVLFKDFNSISQGNNSAGFSAHQEHIDFKSTEVPQVALNENLQVKLWDLNREDRYMLDYTSTFTTPLANGILFEAYRYGGGLGMRFTERWHKDNCTVLTSEGKDRLTADGSNAKWAIVTGESSDGNGTNGILFLSYPKNRMHPEPMRVWPIDGNGGRGDMFFEFCPIRHEEWQIEPNKEYELKYRMVVFDGELTKEEAEAYWQAFAEPFKMEPLKN